MQAAAILMAAYGSHLVLDWTGKDTSSPPGLTIAWPFSATYYVSGWNLFGEVSRRYWLPQEFVARKSARAELGAGSARAAADYCVGDLE